MTWKRRRRLRCWSSGGGLSRKQYWIRRFIFIEDDILRDVYLSTFAETLVTSMILRITPKNTLLGSWLHLGLVVGPDERKTRTSKSS
jgi:hypothetical protein